MTDHDALDIHIRKIQTLPPLPAAVQKLSRLTESAESDIQQISRLISFDESLTAKMLRVVNSAFYGLSQKVENVDRAVIVLGFSQVRSIALSLSIMQMSRSGSAGDEERRTQLWRHAICTAAIARLCARWSGAADAEESFTAGLLHDLGKLVLQEYCPDGYSEVIRQMAVAGDDFCAQERIAVGFDHAQAGERLCAYWNLPDSLRQVVGAHHQSVDAVEFSTRSGRTGALCQLGDSLAKLLQIGDSGNPLIQYGSMNALRCSAPLRREVQDLIGRIPGELSEVESAFGVSFGFACAAPRTETVAVLLADERWRDAAMCALLGCGYSVCECYAPDSTVRPWQAVLTDRPVPDDLQDRIRQDRVKVLSLPLQDPASVGFFPSGMRLAPFLSWIESSLGQ